MRGMTPRRSQSTQRTGAKPYGSNDWISRLSADAARRAAERKRGLRTKAERLRYIKRRWAALHGDCREWVGMQIGSIYAWGTGDLW